MFNKAKIEIYELNLDDIIVTSEPGWDDDDIFLEGELIEE